MLRIRRIGRVFFIENLQQARGLSPDGKEWVEDEWKTVAVAKAVVGDPKSDPRKDAHQWLAKANVDVLRMMLEDRRRQEAAAARGAD